MGEIPRWKAGNFHSQLVFLSEDNFSAFSPINTSLEMDSNTGGTVYFSASQQENLAM